MNRLLLGFAILIVGLGFAGKADTAIPHPSPTCADGDPCWNWRTMGNHKRGIVLTNGRRLVVGPASFDGIEREGRIDWTRTPRLRGDVR